MALNVVPGKLHHATGIVCCVFKFEFKNLAQSLTTPRQPLQGHIHSCCSARRSQTHRSYSPRSFSFSEKERQPLSKLESHRSNQRHARCWSTPHGSITSSKAPRWRQVITCSPQLNFSQEPVDALWQELHPMAHVGGGIFKDGKLLADLHFALVPNSQRIDVKYRCAARSDPHAGHWRLCREQHRAAQRLRGSCPTPNSDPHIDSPTPAFVLCAFPPPWPFQPNPQRA